MPNTFINGKKCFYQDVGKGFPVLLGHSYLWDSNMWDPQLKQLSKEFRCIAVDLWSHGTSDCLDTKYYTIEQLANDYWQLMQALKISEFAVIGLSVGGMWAAHLALNHPDAVKLVVLMDTFLGTEPVVTRQKYFKLLDILEKEERFTDILLDQIVPLFFSPYTLKHQSHLANNFRKALSCIKEEKISGIVTLGRAIFSRNCLLEKLSSLMQPSLILVGKDDIPRPPREAEEMAKRLPNGKMHVIENAGHICNLEQPDLATSHLLNFLSKACEISFANAGSNNQCL